VVRRAARAQARPRDCAEACALRVCLRCRGERELELVGTNPDGWRSKAGTMPRAKEDTEA
jgi:hypothetical protein